jgi:hypothetical protein
MNRRLLSAPFLPIVFFYMWVAFVGSASGQETRGQIAGRVVGTNDAPVVGATVTARPESSDPDTFQAPAAQAVTDGTGAFVLPDLRPRLYRLEVRAKGYAQSEKPIRARIGESPVIALTRGGVITGKVTDRENRPIIEALVRVMRVADAAGKPVPDPFPAFYPTVTTDDRGEYRKWGLTPGRYLVWVEGTDSDYRALDPLEGDIPTYYPSVTRGGAKEVTVTEGGETTGIDIRHRGQRGFAVSGRLAGVPGDSYVTLELLDAETHVPMVTANKNPYKGLEFTAIGVPPGSYDLTAVAYLPKGTRLFSDPIRVVVKGRDVDSLTVTLAPAASVAGTVTLAPPEKTLFEACGGEPATSVEEAAVELALKKESLLTTFQGPTTVPMETGAFQTRGLVAGEYALAIAPPAGWYVASATEPGTPKPKSLGSLLLKKGTSRENIAVTLEFGAATLKGTVSNLPKAVEDVEKLRVHLVPLDEAQVENTARYYETTVAPDGGFELKNLAPGRYAVVIQKKDVPAGENPAFPVALDPAKRKLLRDAAKSAKTLELTPCKTFEGVTVEVKP